MRKFLLFISLFSFAVTSSVAQVLFVNSPADIEGAYLFEAAAFGADITIDTIWTGDLIVADDGSANPSQACEALMNDVTDKVVLIDRGTCEFGLKCLNAEMAGATMVIVANNAAGPPIVMGGGAVGAQVTIPCVMISMDDGQILKDALANGDVNVSLGNIAFANDVSSGVTGLSMPLIGSVPMSQITEAGSYDFTPGALVTNNGMNDAEGVTVSGTITYTPAGGTAETVYEESGAAMETLMVDSSSFISLPTTDLSGVGAGTYNLSYNIAFDNEDESPFDNDFDASFDVTPNVFSKSNWNADTGRPGLTSLFTIAGGGNIEFLAGFDIPNGEDIRIDSVTFYIQTSAASLEGVQATVLLYEWNDGSGATAADDAWNNDELTLIGFNNIVFEAGAPVGQWATLSLLDLNTSEEGVIVGENDKRYIVGTRYEGAEVVFFGFNENYDYTQALDNGIIVSDSELPYVGTQGIVDGIMPDVDAGFIFTGLAAPVVTAMWITDLTTDTEEVLSESEAQVNIFPNPARDFMQVEVTLEELTENFEYRVSDMQGRLIQVIKKNNLKEDISQFNVSELPSGQYLITVATDKGIISKTFLVQK